MTTYLHLTPRHLLALAAVFAAVLAATPAWAGDPVPDVDVILEQVPGGTVKIDSPSGGFDEIELKVGKDFAKALTPESLPAGWSLETEGKSARLSGPAVASGQPVRLKLDAGRTPRPGTISYWVRLEGRTLLERKKVTPTLVPPQQVIGSLSGVVTLPTQVAPGEPMQMQVSEAADLPPGGTWTLSGTVVAEEETGDDEAAQAGGESEELQLRATLSTSRSNLKKTSIASADPEGTVNLLVPEGLEPGDTLALQYIDAYGDLVLDVPEVPDVEVVEASGGDGPRITDAMPRSLAGQRTCVCGVFPGPDAWNGILLDGEAVGAPVAASSRMAWVQLPAGLPPGEHVFTGAPEPGFPPSDRVTTLVLQVGGELDATKLQRLETTPMRLWVEGTDEPVALRVRNLTPGIITLEGGPDQVIRTSGGAPNQLERTVRGVSPGNFDIQYEMAPDTCPCSASSD